MTLPKLALIPSGYKASKVYSALPTNGDGDFTFSRSGTATRVNENGLIETVGSNVPRLDYSDSSCPSLLLEPQRTNLIRYSEDFTNWSDTGVTVTANDAIAPTGAQTADLLTSTANNWRRASYLTLLNGGGYVFSCFVKKHITTDKIRIEIKRGASSSDLYFEFSTKTLSASDGNLINLNVQNYPNDWYRISCKFQANGTNGIIYVYPSEYYNVSGSAYFWGAQLEGGANLPTSYIPTTSSVATRNADLCNNAGNADLFNSTEGVLYVEAFMKDTNSFKTVCRIAETDTSTTNGMWIYFQSDNRIQSVLRIAGVDQADIISNVQIANTNYKVAFKYKKNDFALWVNGIKIGTDISGNTFNVGTLSKLGFVVGASIFPFEGNCKDLRVYNTALSDAELQALTTL